MSFLRHLSVHMFHRGRVSIELGEATSPESPHPGEHKGLSYSNKGIRISKSYGSRLVYGKVGSTLVSRKSK